MRLLPRTKSCVVCGCHNPIGFKLQFETDERCVCARLAFKPEHVGFRGTVHGGMIATLLDEAMAWACVVQTKRFGFCAEMSVRYVRPVQPGPSLVLTGELAANRRDRIYEAKAELRDTAGVLLASATGKYMPLAADQATDFAADFEDDPFLLHAPPAGGVKS